MKSIRLACMLTIGISMVFFSQPIVGEPQHQSNFALFKERVKQLGRVGKRDIDILWRYVHRDPLTQRELNRKDLLLKRLKITVKWLLLLAGVTYGFRKIRTAWQGDEKEGTEERLSEDEYKKRVEQVKDKFFIALRNAIHNAQSPLFSRKQYVIPYEYKSTFEDGGYIVPQRRPSLFLTIANERDQKFISLRIAPDLNFRQDGLVESLKQIARPFKKYGYIISFDSRAQTETWNWFPDWDFIRRQKATQ